ncbi:MAG: hypothetical protein CSA70_00735 [Rhodobacterales bacterium]|nr:MAG: hypothetical protein CSA70_00735 [Rhodobacterales bacterium]
MTFTGFYLALVLVKQFWVADLFLAEARGRSDTTNDHMALIFCSLMRLSGFLKLSKEFCIDLRTTFMRFMVCRFSPS